LGKDLRTSITDGEGILDIQISCLKYVGDGTLNSSYNILSISSSNIDDGYTWVTGIMDLVRLSTNPFLEETLYYYLHTETNNDRRFYYTLPTVDSGVFQMRIENGKVVYFGQK